MIVVVLQKVGKINGVYAYAPIDSEAVKEIGGQEFIVCEIKAGKSKRTWLQNRAIHLYFAMLCDAFNDAGLDMIAVMRKLSKNAKIPWTPNAIKERLWRPVQLSSFGHESTKKLKTDEVSAVYEALNMVTSQELGVGVQFPNYLHQLDDQYETEANRHD